MDLKENQNEILTIILAAIILAVAVSFKDTKIFYAALLSFLIIIIVNVAIKKIIGYHFEINIKAKFWALQNYGFRRDQHFKKQSVVMHRNRPFRVVVIGIKLGMRAETAGFGIDGIRHGCVSRTASASSTPTGCATVSTAA